MSAPQEFAGIRSVYKIREGDDFNRISRRVYGTEAGASTLKGANPELSGGIVPGALIVVPENPDVVSLQKAQAAGGVDEIVITVGAIEFRFWTDAKVTRSMDTVSSFEFAAPFEPDNQIFRSVFRPLSFQPVSITLGGDQLITGTLINTAAELQGSRVVTASGYGKPGVLRDCTMANGTFLEFYDLNLRQIAAELAKPFGIGVVFEAPAGPPFEHVALSAIERPAAFLTKLAQQRNLVISDTPDGKLLFHRTSKLPVFETLEEGELPLRAIDPAFKPQDFYSHISAITPSFWGDDPDAVTVVNKNLRGVVRPFTFRAPDTYGADALESANSKIGRMYANALGYTVTLAGLRDSQGRVWRPNTKVRLLAPSAFIYESTEFLIRSVMSNRRSNSAETTLRLVLPGSFNGEIPEVLPWGS